VTGIPYTAALLVQSFDRSISTLCSVCRSVRFATPSWAPGRIVNIGAGIGDYQSKPEAALPLYSHCRVSSSVHPGTANRGMRVPPLIEGLGLDALIADKAFDSNAIIADLDARGAKVVISQHPRRAKPLAIDDGDVQMAASNRELLRQTEGIQTYRHTRRQDR